MEKQSIDEIEEYEHDSAEECKAAGTHGLSCDRDGYCNFCGYQDYDDEDFDESFRVNKL